MKHGRKALKRSKSIPAVNRRVVKRLPSNRNFKRVLKSSNDDAVFCATQYCVRLAALSITTMSEKDRQKVIADVTKIDIGYDKPRSFKALRWVAQALTKLVPVETDKIVLSWLFRLAAELEDRGGCPFEDTDYEILVKVAIGILKECPGDIRLRCSGLQLLEDMLKFATVEVSRSAEIARICCAIFTEFRAAGGRFEVHTEKWADNFARVGQWNVAEIYGAMAVLFHAVVIGADCSHAMIMCYDLVSVVTDAVPNMHASALLTYMMTECTTEDAAYLIRRHPKELENAFMHIRMDDLWATIEPRSDFIAFIAQNVAILDRLLRVMREEFARPRGNFELGYIVARLLQYALDLDDGYRELNRLLEWGFLDVARVLAHMPEPDEDEATAANTFRSLLAIRPQFKERFRKLTKDGTDDSEVASLGKAIPERLPKPVEYIMEDYVDLL